MICKSLALLDGAEEPPALMAVHVPLALLRERAPEAWLSPILAQHRLQKPETLCLCFDAPLLLEFGADAHDALLHLKRSGVTLAVRGCGADKIPLAPLMRLPVDYAFLSPHLPTTVCTVMSSQGWSVTCTPWDRKSSPRTSPRTDSCVRSNIWNASATCLPNPSPLTAVGDLSSGHRPG